MAGLDLTKLQAVNQMLAGVGQARVAALDSGGSSDAAEAEYHLDMFISEAINEGHPSTTQMLATTASSGIVDLSSAAPLAVRVFGTGKHENKEFSILGTAVYDPYTGSTACFGSTEAVTLKLYVKASASSPANFENLAPDLKHKIARRATLEYRLIKKPDQFMDAGLSRTANRVEQSADALRSTQDSAGAAPFRYGQVGSPNGIASQRGTPQ